MILMFAGVACLVGGVRLLLVAAWAGDAPYADDFNSTGWLHIYASESPGGMPWAWLAQAHVEHRLVTQKLFSLGVAALNGQQWDVRAEMVVSALLWGLLAGTLVAFGARQLRGWRLWAWAAFVVCAEGIPHAWENMLWSFQVHFLFVAGFGLLALWWLMRASALSPAWWGGLVCAVAACASQASGLIVLPAAIVASAIAMVRQSERRTWRIWAGFAVLALLLTLAAMAVKHFSPHDPYRAQSAGHWLRAALRLLAWPWSDWAWMAPVLWAPGVAWACRMIFSRDPEVVRTPVDWFWLGVLGWSAAMAFAVAVSRGELQLLGVPPSRYADVLVVGVMANAYLLLQGGSGRPRPGWLRGGLACVWLAGVVVGLVCYTVQLSMTATAATTVTQLPLRDVIASRPMQADRIREYVRTNDSSLLAMNPPIYPVVAHTAEIIQRLRTAGRWPATLEPGRPPLPWLSRLARGAGFWGWGVLAAGFVFLAGAARGVNRRPEPA